MKFIATVEGTPVTLRVIQADSWYDAHRYAKKVLHPYDTTKPGTSTLLVTQTGEEAGEEVQITWVGSDAGRTPDRHKEFRTRPTTSTGWGDWTDWERE